MKKESFLQRARGQLLNPISRAVAAAEEVLEHNSEGHDREALLARDIRIGVRLASDDPVEDLAADLERIELIAIEFPKFTDGRGYSTARILRERYGYFGEIRAVGNVLRDQLSFMNRCGFDAVELSSDAAERDWRDALGEIDGQYQPLVEGRQSP